MPTGNSSARFTAGLLAASAIGIGAGYYLLGEARSIERQALDRRQAIVTARGLTEVVEKNGGTGDGVRAAATAWQGAHAGVAEIRVLAFSGISLEASTAAIDTGEKAAPRRLAKSEKPFYDRGQRLRAAFETNREEVVARKDEIEIATGDAGGMSVACPVEIDGSVVGMVELQMRAGETAARPSVLIAIALALGPAALFFLLARLLVGNRPLPLALISGWLLVGTLGAMGVHSVSVLARDMKATDLSVAALVKSDAVLAGKLLAEQSLPAPESPSRWDSDLYRKPYGIVRDDGSLDDAKIAGRIDAVGTNVRKVITLLGALALALMLAIGLGFVSRIVTVLFANRRAYYYTLPAMLGMIVLVFFPFFYGIALSFTDSNIYNTSKSIGETWIGLGNYTQIMMDLKVAERAADGALAFNYKNFYWTLMVTVTWTVLNVAFGVTFGLILALILNTKGLAMRPLYRVLLILPWAMPNYITALIWKGMFHRQFGVVNQFLQMFGSTAVSWFDSPVSSFFTALATNCWLSFPFMMVVSLGALQSIPGELYEAARVDGASRWQQFRAITLPSLKPALIPAIIISVVWTFNMFNIIYLVTAGEPASSTEILITQAYKFAFQEYRYGYAAAYSTVIFGILLVYGMIQTRITRATESI